MKSLTLVNASPSGWQPRGEIPPLLMEMFAAVQAGDTAAASELQLRIWFDGPDRDKTRFSPVIREARRRASRRRAEGIPGTRRVEIDGGHTAPLEDPEGFAALWEKI